MNESSIVITDQFRQIIGKPKKERLTIDNDFLSLHLMKLSFFSTILDSSEFGLLMYQTLISCLDFKVYQPNESIFKYKEPYNSMFIVIDGSIVIYKPQKEFLYNSILSYHHNNKSASLKTIKKFVPVQVFKELDKVITQGEAYGEKDIKRLKHHPCLVETKTKCIIGLLALTDYSLIFEKTQFLEKVTINRLLCSIPFFTNLNQNMINNFVLAIEKETYKKGEYVVKQGTEIKKIYIVRKGLFLVSLKNTQRFFNNFDMSYFDKLQNNPERFSTNRQFELKESYNTIVEYKLINYGPGEMIGDCEYKLKSDLSYFTIQCDIDSSELLSINMPQFTQYLIPKDIPIFHDKVNEKLSYLKKRFNSIRICQNKLFHQNNKYAYAILQKLPNARNQIKNIALRSKSHEKKFNKIVAVSNDEKKRLRSFVNYKRIKYSSNLSIEYSEMNIHDYMATYSTYMTKNRAESAGTRIFNKQMKKCCTPKKINIHIIRDKNSSLHNLLLLAKYNDKSFIEDNKKNRLMCNKDYFQIKKKKIEDKKLNFLSCYGLTKKVFLRNNSCKIINNLNAIFESIKNDSI